MEYKVYKYIRHEPVVFGLNYSSARIFGAAAAFGMMLMLNGFSLLKIGVISVGLLLLHLLLSFFQRRKPSGNLPKVIINQSWRKKRP